MSDHPYGWLSLLPPLVAVLLAIWTRRIVLSLVCGIFAGALVMARGDLSLAVYHTWETHLWTTLTDPGKLRVFSFTLLMGAMIGVITSSGGMHGLIHLVSPWASNRRRGQLATWGLGLLVFFDDYANTILLGNTLRPICDRLRISREKLAYLVDSTAAPVAGLALVSTWVAVEIDYIGSGLESISNDELSAFGLFLASIPYRFYVWTALLLVPLTALLGRDMGPMLRAERRCLAGVPSDGGEASGPNPVMDPESADDRTSATAEDSASGWYHAVLPIGLTLTLVVIFIYTTGCRAVGETAVKRAVAAAEAMQVDPELLAQAKVELLRDQGDTLPSAQAAIDAFGKKIGGDGALPDAFHPTFQLRDIVGAGKSSLALQYGALAGLSLALLLPWGARHRTLEQLLQGATSGVKVVLPAVAILWCASSMSRMTTDKSWQGEKTQTPYQFQDHRLYTAAFLTSLLAETAPETDADSPLQAKVSVRFLPTVVFILAAVVAFCTGTSYGTMGILVPMVIQLAHALLTQGGSRGVDGSDPILLSSIAGVLAGAVFGDHCSPISDTTVLSSQSSGCDHLAHVATQMPYAIGAAAVSIVLGTLPIGFGWSVWWLLPMQVVALVGILRVFGRRVEL